MSAKALVDQNRMFIHRKLVSINVKNFDIPSTNIQERDGLGPSSGSQKPTDTFAAQKGKMDKNLQQKSRKTCSLARHSDRMVILKPAPKNAKYSANVTCHCSSLQSHKFLKRRVSDAKMKSFSFREMKKKLKHTFGVARNEPSEFSMVDTSNQVSHNKHLKNLDISSVGISNKQEFDVILEAKKHLSARFKNLNPVETVTSKSSLKTLGRILSSPEHDFWPLSPRNDRQHGSSFSQMRFSPYNMSPVFSESNSKIPNGRERAGLSPFRPNTEVSSCDKDNEYDGTLWMVDTERRSPIPSANEGAGDDDILVTDDMKHKGETEIVEMDNIVGPQVHTSEDSLSENDAFTSTVDDYPSTHSSIYRLHTADTIKHQEERQSPVSVLEPFFVEDSNSPPSVTFQNRKFKDGHLLKPCHLDFEQCSYNSFAQDQPTNTNSCAQEQYRLSQYVHLVLHASSLNWNHRSEITYPHDELLDSSLFDEVEYLLRDCYFDPKLLIDRINEVLLVTKPETQCAPLAELVIDEIMTGANFFVSPRTEKRTLDQLVYGDVVKCRTWLDVRLDTEEIVVEIAEEFLEESILDVLLEFDTWSIWS